MASLKEIVNNRSGANVIASDIARDLDKRQRYRVTEFPAIDLVSVTIVDRRGDELGTYRINVVETRASVDRHRKRG